MPFNFSLSSEFGWNATYSNVSVGNKSIFLLESTPCYSCASWSIITIILRLWVWRSLEGKVKFYLCWPIASFHKCLENSMGIFLNTFDYSIYIFFYKLWNSTEMFLSRPLTCPLSTHSFILFVTLRKITCNLFFPSYSFHINVSFSFSSSFPNALPVHGPPQKIHGTLWLS